MFDVKSMFMARELCAREYKKLDNVFFKNIYASNKDETLLDKNIYVFADQEGIVLDELCRGADYTIEKLDKIVVGAKPPFEKIYVVVLDSLGHKTLNINYKSRIYTKMSSNMRNALLVSLVNEKVAGQ